MTQSPRTSPRHEYLLEENARAEASPSLAHQFPNLKSLTVDLGYYDSEGRLRSSQIKYAVNLTHAKSVFRVSCQNPECVRGDFDLTHALAEAVGAGSTSVSSELRCHGWRSRTTIDSVQCGKILRYKISLGY